MHNILVQPEEQLLLKILPFGFERLLSFYRCKKDDTLNLVIQDLYCLHSQWHAHWSRPLYFLSFVKWTLSTKTSRTLFLSVFFLARGLYQACGRFLCTVCMLDVHLERLHVCTPPHSSGSFPVIQQSQGGARLSTCTATLLNSSTHTKQV